MKYIIRVAIIVLLFVACKSSSNNKITFDHNVKYEVYENIVDTLTQIENYCSYLQKTKAKFEFYENDTLFFGIGDSTTLTDFWSTWKFEENTLIINGSFGSKHTGQFGFQINYDKKNNAEVFLFTRGHLLPQYSLTMNGELDFNLLVPTKKWSCRLSGIPKKKKSEEYIFGHIILESNDFFQSNKYKNGVELIETRNKVKSNMEIYFKSRKC